MRFAGARDVIELIDEECARLQRRERLRLARLCSETADPIKRLALGVDKRLSEHARDAQELVPMLIADPGRDRHRHDAAEDRRPEGIDELLVVRDKQDQLVAGLRAQALQVKQDAERALVELLIGNRALLALPLEIPQGEFDSAVAFDDFGERLSGRHGRRSSRMNRGYLVRRLICASSSSGRSGV